MDLEKIKHQVQKVITTVAIGYTFDYIRDKYDDKTIIKSYKQMKLWRTENNDFCVLFMANVEETLSTKEYPELWI